MAGLGAARLKTERKALRRMTALVAMLAMAFSLAAAAGASAQNDKKKKKNEPPKVNNDNANPVVPLSDEQQIDYMLSEYLGAWQLGHRAHAQILLGRRFCGERRMGCAGGRMDEFQGALRTAKIAHAESATRPDGHLH